MTRPLTRRQREVLQAIHDYQAEEGLAPTLEELGQRFGVNRVTVFGHVQALIHKGFLEKVTPGASRNLDLTTSGRDLLQPGLPFEWPDPVHEPAPPPMPSVPLIGTIAAGQPIEAIEDPEPIPLDELVPVADDLYALKVRGDSMIEDNIQEGDLVFVRRNRPPRDGDIVVAILDDNEATLKRLYQEKDGWRLQPANARLDPVFTNRLEVRGVVTGVLRRF